MSDSAAFRYPGNLDPTAQEFVPRKPDTNPISFFAPASLYFPYSPHPPAPSLFHLPPPPSYPPDELRLVPFYPPPPPPLEYSVGGDAAEPYLRVAPAPLLPPTSVAPTRALVVISVPSDVSESTVRRDLEVFGEVRGVEMERVVDERIVTVHFYDLRHAQSALREIRDQHMHQQVRFRNTTQIMGLNDVLAGMFINNGNAPARGLVSGRAVWAHFVIPASNAVPDGNNQGTLVILNLEPTVSSNTLRGIFQAYGDVKELRETPFKRHQRFVEFYDVRDAAKALRAMDGKEIQGKPVTIQFSRPGGLTKRLFLTSHNHYNNYNNSLNVLNPPSPPPSREFSGHSPPSHHHHGRQSKKPVNSSRRWAAVASMADSQQMLTGNVRKSQQSSSRSYRQQHQQQQRNSNGKAWKNNNKHTKKKRDACFVISEDAIADSSCCRDDRTTLMIKNIPNKYSQKLLLNMLDNHCIHYNEEIARQGNAEDMPLSSYDFVYLPIDFNNKCNVGYGFVNMTSPQAAWRLYKAFHRQHWEVFNSRKICEVTYARVQGLEALREHFKNSKFPCSTEQYMPVVFSPARDGRRLTEPEPIAELAARSSISNCRHKIDGAVLSSRESCPSSDRQNNEDKPRCDGCCCSCNDGGSGEDSEQNGGVLDNEAVVVVSDDDDEHSE